ncbi:MDR family MFS transporter [Aliikangiella maris]|uniref:MFS transporter n=2 Tax=Aliikangiella maris TaxID=3162458 RepID=A0ABV2BR76_9GAMM
MSRIQFTKQFGQFPALIWLYLVGTLMTRGCYYMVWPFLSVILYREFSLSATNIGMILTCSAVGSSLVGFYVGSLTDRIGRRSTILISGIIGFIAFCLLAFANSLWLYIVAITLSSLSRALWDSPSKALIGDLLKKAETREMALQLSYFMTNVGVAIGPLIGILLGLSAQKETFLFTATAYLILTVGLYIGFNYNAHLLKRQKLTTYNFSQTIGILLNDHLFLVLIIANIIVMFVYSHSDSSLIQYLTQANAPDLLQLISALIITNSLTIVLFQFPLLRLLQNFSINQRIHVGLVLLFSSQVLYIYSPVDSYWMWIGGMFILSLGEAILFPTMNIQIDRLAPKHLRGSYFGATSFYSLGYASSPIIGGYIIDQYGGSVLYELTSILILLTVTLYLFSHRFKRPTFMTTDAITEVTTE